LTAAAPFTIFADPLAPKGIKLRMGTHASILVEMPLGYPACQP